MKQRQINVRLPSDDVEQIEAAAFLDHISVAEYLKPVFEGLVANLRADPDVQLMVRLRAERAAQKEGRLSKIGGRRREGDRR